MSRKFFKYKNKELPLPLFFPDATKAVVRSVDSQDIINTKTPGILVNTLHLYLDLGKKVLDKFKATLESTKSRKFYDKQEIEQKLNQIIRGQFINEILKFSFIELANG